MDWKKVCLLQGTCFHLLEKGTLKHTYLQCTQQAWCPLALCSVLPAQPYFASSLLLAWKMYSGLIWPLSNSPVTIPPSGNAVFLDDQDTTLCSPSAPSSSSQALKRWLPFRVLPCSVFLCYLTHLCEWSQSLSLNTCRVPTPWLAVF